MVLNLKKEKKLKSKIFNRFEYKFYVVFVLTVFCIVLLTSMIQAFFTVNTYEKKMLENYYNYTEISFEQFKNSTIEIIGQAKSLAAKLTLDKEINDLVRSGKAKNESDVMKYVNDCAIITPHVVDIAFYNPDMDEIYSIKGQYMSPDEYWKGMTLETLIESEKNEFVVRPTQTVFSAKNLLTVVFSSNPYYDSYIIVDLNYDEIQREFERYAKKLDCCLYVASSAQTLYQTDEKLFDSGKIKQHIENIEESERITLKINGTKYGALFIKSDTIGLRCVMLTEYSKIKANYIIQSQIRFIAVYISILLIGLIILYFSMNFVYKPVRKIEEGYKNFLLNNEKNNEKKLLMEFLSVPVLNEKKVLKVFENVKKQLESTESLHLILVTIDDYSEFLKNHTAEEQKAYAFGVENICTEIITGFFRYIVMDAGEDSLLFLVSGVEDEHDLITAFSESAGYINEYLGLFISTLITEKYCFDNLNDAYNEIMRLKKYRLLFPHNTILSTDILEKNCEYDLNTDPSQIIKYIQSGNFSDAYMLLEKHIQSFKKVNPDQIVSELMNLFVMSYEEIKSQVGNFDDVSLHRFLKALLEAESIEDVKSEFSKLFQLAEHMKKDISDNKYNVLVETIYKIIEKNWSDPGFCVDTIASELKYSGVYLSRIFKYVTGNQLSAQIMSRRIEESEKMLRNSDYSVKTVCEKCGFSSMSYFSVLFKKKYGLAPSEYRRNLNIE